MRSSQRAEPSPRISPPEVNDMPLAFRNIDVTPNDPVEAWGFEGMLAALDRGYLQHWARIADAVHANPDLRAVFEEAADAAESTSAVEYVRLLLAMKGRSPSEIAHDRLVTAFRKTRMTQQQVAERLGTSRPRLSTYLSGKVTPSMDVLVALESLAEERVAPLLAPRLVLM